MKIIELTKFFRKVINYANSKKIRQEYDALKYKIYIFTPSIVNQLTMYINTYQLITNK